MKVKLETFLREISEKTTRNNQYPVLTSSKNGLFLQSDYFNKQVASKDNTGYKIIKSGQFTYRAMSDTGEFFPNILDCTYIGIVSPAYPVFEVTDTNIIIPDYLKYYFKSKSFQKSISAFIQGSTRSNIKFNKMKTIEIECPSIERQKNIVRIFSTLTNRIGRQQDQLLKLDDLVKARFVEMFGSPENNFRGCRKTKLGDACNFINGKAFKPSDWSTHGTPIIRIQNLNDEKSKFNYYEGLVEEKYRVREGDLLFSWSGTPGTSFGAFFWRRGDGVLNQHIFNVKPKIDIDMRYLKDALNDRLSIMIGRAHGGVGLQHITKNELETIEILTPDTNRQESYSTFVSQVDKSKFAIQKSLEKTQLLFDALMQEYFG